MLGLQTEQEAGGEVFDVIHTFHVVTVLSEITCNTVIVSHKYLIIIIIIIVKVYAQILKQICSSVEDFKPCLALNFRAGVDFIYFRSMYIARVHKRKMHLCNKTGNVIFRSHFWNDKGLYIASYEWGISQNMFCLRLLNFVKGPLPIIFQFYTPVSLSLSKCCYLHEEKIFALLIEFWLLPSISVEDSRVFFMFLSKCSLSEKLPSGWLLDICPLYRPGHNVLVCSY